MLSRTYNENSVYVKVNAFRESIVLTQFENEVSLVQWQHTCQDYVSINWIKIIVSEQFCATTISIRTNRNLVLEI
jgi:hypothetical protein